MVAFVIECELAGPSERVGPPDPPTGVRTSPRSDPARVEAAIADESHKVREYFAGSSELTAEQLTILLGDPVRSVRVAALRRRELLSERQIVEALEDRSVPVRKQAVATLARLEPSERAVELALRNESSEVRALAVELLAGRMTTEQMERALCDADAFVRAAAVTVAERLTPGQMIAALADFSYAVRAAALEHHKDGLVPEILDKVCAVRVNRLVERHL